MDQLRTLIKRKGLFLKWTMEIDVFREIFCGSLILSKRYKTGLFIRNEFY